MLYVLTNSYRYKNKAPRPPPSTVDFYFSDITANTTPIVDGDSAKQNEIIAQRILFTQCHRDLEQDSNKGIEFIPVSATCYDDSTKYHSERVETLLKLCDEIRPNLMLATGGTRISLHDITPE
ncbi:unnamed protein product, partial [Rotaria magnacalcarata]